MDLKQNFNAKFCWNKFSNRSHSLICISVFVLLFVAVIQNVFVQNKIYSHFCSVDVLRYHMARCQQSRTNRKIFSSVLFSLRHILFFYFCTYKNLTGARKSIVCVFIFVKSKYQHFLAAKKNNCRIFGWIFCFVNNNIIVFFFVRSCYTFRLPAWPEKLSHFFYCWTTFILWFMTMFNVLTIKKYNQWSHHHHINILTKCLSYC